MLPPSERRYSSWPSMNLWRGAYPSNRKRERKRLRVKKEGGAIATVLRSSGKIWTSNARERAKRGGREYGGDAAPMQGGRKCIKTAALPAVVYRMKSSSVRGGCRFVQLCPKKAIVR